MPTGKGGALGIALFAMAGCGRGDGATEAAAGGADESPRRFSWVVQDRVGGLAYPGEGAELDRNLRWLADREVKLLVSLTEQSVDATKVEATGMRPLHLPVEDFTAPTTEQLAAFVGATNAQLQSGGAVAVHCAGGKGRTGTFLAAYLISEGQGAEEAIATIRRQRPGSIETESQEQILRAYAAKLGRQ